MKTTKDYAALSSKNKINTRPVVEEANSHCRNWTH